MGLHLSGRVWACLLATWVVWGSTYLAIKYALPRRLCAGTPGDGDVYGAQQHAPMLDVELDVVLDVALDGAP